MGWLAGRMVEWLMIHEAVAEEDRELYEYAAVCVLMTVAPLFMAILVGGLMGELRTGIIMILPFIALRKFSGGYHAKHMGTCWFGSFGLLAVCTWLAARLVYSWQLCAGMFLGAMGLFLLSPIDSENRRLDEEDKRRYRHVTGGLSFIICIVSVLWKLCGDEKAAVCMAIGLLLTSVLQIPCVLHKVIGNMKT